ncbi:MAG: hypothetical protein HY925_02790 [Elusimicrobia bacterium]|nr:hypothetical protein [Elusimicrobiota bacterium]
MMELWPARAVAKAQLEANLRALGNGRTVLVAGANQYGSVWARDFCFASGGLLAAGLRQPVLDTLEELVALQREDGLYPRLLDSLHPLARFLRGTFGQKLSLSSPLRPNFVSDHLVWSFDTNALVVDALRRAGLAEKHAASIERALSWCRSEMRDGLIFQPPFSDWKDTISSRRGHVFFTQLQFWKALGRAQETDEFAARLRRAFWLGEYFADTTEFPLLSTDGNLAAIAWGFSTQDETERILDAIEAKGLWTPWGPKAGERYSYFEKGWFARLALVHGYQDDFVWLWVSALALRALHRAGRVERRDALLRTLCERIVREKSISEVYRPEDGQEVRTWLYRSEAPFSWSSGMLLEAFDEVNLGTGPKLTLAD